MADEIPADPTAQAMSGDLPVDPDARALADELREIARALADLEIPSSDFADALPLARELRARLAGPRRQRWYDAQDDAFYGPLAKRSYQDLSPVRGVLNPVAPPLELRVEEFPDGPRIVGRACLPCTYEGPPHGVHGGIVAAMFDEILGAAMILAPPPGVTAKLDVRYRHVTPLDEELRFEARVAENRDRRITIRATCHAGETLTADATGLFVRVDFSEVQERMAARRAAGG